MPTKNEIRKKRIALKRKAKAKKKLVNLALLSIWPGTGNPSTAGVIERSYR